MPLTRCLRLLGLSLLLSALPALAANRTLSIQAPTRIRAGASADVMVFATTDAKDDEHVGFLHAEYSLDDGRTWVPVYRDNLERNASLAFSVTMGSAGTPIRLRARVAFRGGDAGDVDHLGRPIEWDRSWDKWEEPTARYRVIAVLPPAVPDARFDRITRT